MGLEAECPPGKSLPVPVPRPGCWRDCSDLVGLSWGRGGLAGAQLRQQTHWVSPLPPCPPRGAGQAGGDFPRVSLQPAPTGIQGSACGVPSRLESRGQPAVSYPAASPLAEHRARLRGAGGALRGRRGAAWMWGPSHRQRPCSRSSCGAQGGAHGQGGGYWEGGLGARSLGDDQRRAVLLTATGARCPAARQAWEAPRPGDTGS